MQRGDLRALGLRRAEFLGIRHPRDPLMNHVERLLVHDPRADARHPRAAERRDPVIEHRPLGLAGGDDHRVGDPERPLHGPAADGLGVLELVPVCQLDEGVAAAVGDVADRAVDVQIGPRPVVRGRPSRRTGSTNLGNGLGRVRQRRLEEADVVEGAELVVHDAAVVVVPVHLRRVQAQDEPGRARVAEHALAAAGDAPGLSAGLPPGAAGSLMVRTWSAPFAPTSVASVRASFQR